jgi:hypothetical protein
MEILNLAVLLFRGLRRPLSVATCKRRFSGSMARIKGRGTRGLPDAGLCRAVSVVVGPR